MRGRLPVAGCVINANDEALPDPRGILVEHRDPCSSILNLCELEYPATGPHSTVAMDPYIQAHGAGPALICVANPHAIAPTLPVPTVYRRPPPDALCIPFRPYGHSKSLSTPSFVYSSNTWLIA
jgi:hypothetical protein